MSVRTMARVWELSSHRGNDLLMLLAIADFADDEGNAYPSVTTLATKCRMKSRNANLILATLRESGELEVRHNEGPHGTNRYRIILPRAPLQIPTGVQKPTPLQKRAAPPVDTCSKPLHVSTDEPSVNHQEPPVNIPTGKKSLCCPVEKIVAAYHEAMPLNPRVKVLNDQRRKAITSRWREASSLDCAPFGYSTVEDGIAAWQRFFEICAESPFLTGRADPKSGQPTFIADLDFLITPRYFARCLENKYHRETSQ